MIGRNLFRPLRGALGQLLAPAGRLVRLLRWLIVHRGTEQGERLYGRETIDLLEPQASKVAPRRLRTRIGLRRQLLRRAAVSTLVGLAAALLLPAPSALTAHALKFPVLSPDLVSVLASDSGLLVVPSHSTSASDVSTAEQAVLAANEPGTTISAEELAYVSSVEGDTPILAWALSIIPGTPEFSSGYPGSGPSLAANYRVDFVDALSGTWLFGRSGYDSNVLVPPFPVPPIGQPSPLSGYGDGCNPNRPDNYRDYYFAGMYMNTSSFPGTNGGVYAKIKAYSPYVAPSDFGASEWVMVTGGTWPNLSYAQVGWFEQPHGTRNTFTEISYQSSWYVDGWYNAETVNSTPTYKLLYNPNPPNQNQYFTFYASGLKGPHGTSWINDAGGIFAPNSAQINAEIHTQATQMAGGYNNRNPVTGANYYYPAGTGGSWHSFQGSPAVEQNGSNDNQTLPVPSWANESPSTGSNLTGFSTWDSACAN